MRIASYFTCATFALASLLSGCIAGTDEADSIDDGPAAEEEDVGEAQGALVGCAGETCNGQDPGALGCEADATTVASSPIFDSAFNVVGTIAIRRSAACNALWARASTSSGTAFIRSEIARSSPALAGQAASLSPVSAQRSPMAGKLTSTTYTAKGFTGTSYDSFPNQGQVSKSY